jgi:hypothetical protein
MSLSKKTTKVILSFISVIVCLTLLLLFGFHYLIKDSLLGDKNVISCDESSFDFGELYRPVRGKLKHTYIIKNTSPRSVKLNVSKKTCNCTEVNFSSTTVPSGGKTELTIAWDAPNRPGDTMLGAVVETVPPGDGEIKLYGKVSVKDCITVEPLQISFGNVKPNEIKTKEIKISAPLGKSLQDNISFLVKESLNHEFRTEFTKITNHKMVVKASILGQAGKGYMDYLLVVKTGEPIQPEIEIPINANHLDAYIAKPAAVFLKKDQTENQTKWVEIISNVDIPAKIDKIVIDDPTGISAQVQESDSSVKLGLKQKSEKEENGPYVGTVKAFIVGQDNPVLIRYMRL